jgi:hypothetical protein
MMNRLKQALRAFSGIFEPHEILILWKDFPVVRWWNEPAVAFDEFGEGFLDGVEIRAVGRKETYRCADRFDDFVNLVAIMAA